MPRDLFAVRGGLHGRSSSVVHSVAEDKKVASVLFYLRREMRVKSFYAVLRIPAPDRSVYECYRAFVPPRNFGEMPAVSVIRFRHNETDGTIVYTGKCADEQDRKDG